MPVQDELINFSQWPTAPMPWLSREPGDSYIWEDYVLLFQVGPPTIADGMRFMSDALKNGPASHINLATSAVVYRYSLTVLFRRHINPSERPVRLFGLEQIDMNKVSPDLKKLMPKTGTSIMPPVIGEFTPRARYNHGYYSGNIEYKEVRHALIECARKSLDLTGKPEWIGTLADAKGHPKTGFPAGEPQEEPSPKSGCLSCLLLASGVGLSLYFTLMYNTVSA